MRLFLVFILLCFGASAFAADRMLTCAVGYVHDYSGVRVNIIESQGKLKATVFEGTTQNSSGTYLASRVQAGFLGVNRNGVKSFALALSNSQAQNAYIKGVQARLVVAVIETSSGPKNLTTSISDNFVCGEQIAPYRH